MNILHEIVRSKESEIASLKAKKLDFKTSIAARRDRFNVIGEIKPASPSRGQILNRDHIAEHIKAYKENAVAISVLTDKNHFGGGYDLLRQVKQAAGDMPVLQKDFITDEIQLLEGFKAGADAALLIVKILRIEKLAALYQLATSLGIEAVFEVSDEADLTKALSLCPDVILINNRNLDTMDIDLATTGRLTALIPPDIRAETVIISASGYESREQMGDFGRAADAFLIGSSLMNSKNPEALLQEFCLKETA